MATDKAFLERYIGALSDAGVSYRKMFGEYAVYCNGKVYALVCDNRFLVKPTAAARALLPDAPLELPYRDGRPMLLVRDVGNTALMCALARDVSAELPAPRRKK